MPTDTLSRKLAVVLHADVAGYGVLMERDQDATHRAVTAQFDALAAAVERFGGQVLEKRGDAVLAEFGPPSDAIACALNFQREAAERLNPDVEGEPRVRIGINIGEVLLDRDTVWGRGVSLAQRAEELAEPGGVCVTASVYDAVARSASVEYLDLGEQDLGEAAMRVYGVRIAEGAELPAARVDTSRPVPGFGGRAAVAVLPFQNRTSSEEMAYLADGIAEDVISRLQRYRTVPVISRSASFAHRDDPPDFQRIDRELGVGYAVTGLLRRSGDRLRLAVELIDTSTRASVWSVNYDRDMANLFDLQDEISLAVVSRLVPELERAELAKPDPPDLHQVQAWHLLRRGAWHQYRLRREDAVQALRYFETALDRDPNSAEAMIQLAWWHWWNATESRRREPGVWDAMEDYIRRAQAIDPHDSRVPMLAGIAAMMKGHLLESRRLFEETLELNPSYAEAHCYLGSTWTLCGRPERAVEPIRTSLRLSPFGFTVFHTWGELANARYMLGQFDEAVAAADASLRLRPGYWLAHIVRVGSLARSGRADLAADALAELLSLRSEHLTADIDWIMYEDPQWNRYLKEGLVMAGWNAPAGSVA